MNKMKKLTLGLVLMLSALLVMTAGCGKNAVGPTTPSMSLESEELSDTAAMQEYSIACHRGEGGLGPRAWMYRFMMRLTPVKILQTSDEISEGYFTDPEVKRTVKRVLTSRLFYLIAFNHGAAYLMVDTFIRIISNAWSPEGDENPGAFPAKVTLFPRDWNRHQLFHGQLQAGWLNPGPGRYVMDQYNATNQRVTLNTSTIDMDTDGDFYQNQNNFRVYRWYFGTSINLARAKVSFQYNPEPDMRLLSFDGQSTFTDEDGSMIIFDEVWASVKDKSARCHIRSSSGVLDINLTFAADGSGSGSMDIRNVFGATTHYDYVQYANGHGYWKKNGGKKRGF